MGRGQAFRARTSGIRAVGPPAALAALGSAATAAAAHVAAPLFHGGPWAWLGDTTFVVDVGAALGVLGIPTGLRAERVRRSGIAEVDEMSGGEFEGRLENLFGDLGFVVTRTGASGDFGADLVCERDGERVVVQAKRYEGSVGIEAVQQVVGATRYYDAGRALVVTNSACTPAATALAHVHDVELVERDALVRLLAAHPLAEGGATAAALLGREVAAGATLAGFAAVRLFGLAWWILRAACRAPFVLRRARR